MLSMSKHEVRRLAVVLTVGGAVLPIVTVIGKSSGQTPQALKCDVGPITKTFAETQWLVYSCDDNRSVVIVTATGNPAMPFYFLFSPGEGGYRLSGEGTGRKDVTAAAFEELKAYSEPDIAALIQQTRSR
jgi:hypothetical protein